MKHAAPHGTRSTTTEDHAPNVEEIIAGLSKPQKTLPSKYFYDKRGSKLFDRICELPEYYPTRCELAIMQEHAAEMGEQIGPGVRLVEYGSGSSIKSRLLLDNLPDPVAYVPVDISRQHLLQTARQLSRSYPHIEILPVSADFTKDFALPASIRPPTHTAVYFPGSTIGNFETAEASQLLMRIAGLCGTGGGLILGIDLKKSIHVLRAAYNDAAGVTRQFNLNLLRRLNRQIGTDFDLRQFEHEAEYCPEPGRIEMYLVSQRDQIVHVDDTQVFLRAGERICTEYSHKYHIDEFATLASRAGLTLRRVWTDRKKYFAVAHFAVLP